MEFSFSDYFRCTFDVFEYFSVEKNPLGLKRGQPVSIVCETIDGGGNVYLYGEIAEDQVNSAATTCLRILKDNKEYSFMCEHIKVREVVSVSDSKLHDPYFVRHFLSYILLGPNGWLLNQTREPDLFSRIRAIDICGDGAAAHFKQKGSIHFISSLNTYSYT